MDSVSINKGKQLKFARIYRGYTQSELCKHIEGLNHSNLSKYENGFKDKISEKLERKIMTFLDWNYDWLYVKSPNEHYKYH